MNPLLIILFIFVGIALLLPGFITDAIGFLLLITPVRRGFILWWLLSRGVMQPSTPGWPGKPVADLY